MDQPSRARASRRVRFAAPLAAVLLAAACGGGDTPGPLATDTASGPTPTANAPGSRTPTPGASAAPKLAGTSWTVKTYSLGSGALTNPWPDTEITLRFGSDSSLSGSAGCNDYGASFAVEGPYDEFVQGVRDAKDGQVIRIEQLAATEKACTPGRVMEQESDFLDLLRRTGRWLIARGNLNLRTADGSFLLEAEPAD